MVTKPCSTIPSNIIHNIVHTNNWTYYCISNSIWGFNRNRSQHILQSTGEHNLTVILSHWDKNE